MTVPNRIPSRRTTDPEFQAEMEGILSREATVVSMLDPLNLAMSKVWLIHVVQENLEALRLTRETELARQPEEHREVFLHSWDALEQQHIDFLAWLRDQPDNEVWISLYPKGNAMGEWDTNGETLKLIDPDSESDDESLPF